mmetsp:Transcript_50257/g.119507  ORF Transcript_50257/g.119507 Transcript_50257/m.119507 type:complete len:300 (-) Transcript_50257:1171-2070(-)
MAPDLVMTLASFAETTLHESRSADPKARRLASSKVGTTTVLPVAYHIAFSTALSKSMRSRASLAPLIIRSRSSGGCAEMESSGRKFIGRTFLSLRCSMHLRTVSSLSTMTASMLESITTAIASSCCFCRTLQRSETRPRTPGKDCIRYSRCSLNCSWCLLDRWSARASPISLIIFTSISCSTLRWAISLLSFLSRSSISLFSLCFCSLSVSWSVPCFTRSDVWSLTLASRSSRLCFLRESSDLSWSRLPSSSCTARSDLSSACLALWDLAPAICLSVLYWEVCCPPSWIALLWFFSSIA